MGNTLIVSAAAPIVITIVVMIIVIRVMKKSLGGSGGRLGGLGNSFSGTPGGGTSPEVSRLMASGGKARARVMNVRSTGVVINHVNVRSEITFELQPLDGGPAFTGSKVATLSPTNMPRLGDQFPCWFDRNDHSVFTVALTQQLSHDTVPMYREFGIPHPLDQGKAMSGQAGAAGSAAGSAGSTVEQLAKLAAMHAAGQLTNEEFAAAKAQLLS